VSLDANFGTLKVSPAFYWSDAEMEAYLTQHNLPNEWDYFDPAKPTKNASAASTPRGGGALVKK